MPSEKLEKLEHERYVAERKLTAELDDALGYSKYDYKNLDFTQNLGRCRTQ